MTGCSICSDNNLRKRKPQGLETVATEMISEVNTELEKRSDKCKTTNQEINSQHVTLNQTIQG